MSDAKRPSLAGDESQLIELLRSKLVEMGQEHALVIASLMQARLDLANAVAREREAVDKILRMAGLIFPAGLGSMDLLHYLTTAIHADRGERDR